jgi:hypothetical protein
MKEVLTEINAKMILNSIAVEIFNTPHSAMDIFRWNINK